MSLFYVGKLPRSGTFGTLASLPIYYFFYQMDKAYGGEWKIYSLLTLTLFVLSLFLVVSYERDTKTSDSSFIVIDECLGFLVTMIFLPFDVFYIVLGFFVFRFFDILKPLGIRFLEKKFKNAFGVIADDILAGIYSNLVLQAFVWSSFV